MTLARRDTNFVFDEPVPNHWLDSNSFESHFLNAYTALIPDGEQFIIRSTRHFAETLSDDQRSEVKALFYQEGQHSIQHRKALTELKRQNYHIEGYSDSIRKIGYETIEPKTNKKLLLSTCSGTEHFNACIAEFFLKRDPFMNGSKNEMTNMFAWHFAEEIEHGTVVYDVLKSVDNGYLLRILGLLVSFISFVPSLYIGAMVLAYQDRSLFGFKFWKELFVFTFLKGFIYSFLRFFISYLSPYFHPSAILRNDLVDKGLRIYADGIQAKAAKTSIPRPAEYPAETPGETAVELDQKREMA